MQGAKDSDYRNAVAKNLITHKSDINSVQSTLNNQYNVNGAQQHTDGKVRNSGVLETMDNHTTELGSHATELASHASSIGTINSNLNYGPAICYNGANWYIWVTGTNHLLWRTAWTTAWTAWTVTVHSGDSKEWWISQPSVWCPPGTGTDIHIVVYGYLNAETAPSVHHATYDTSAGSLSAWDSPGGSVGP